MLPAYVASFKQNNPGVRLTVVMDNTQHILQQLTAFDLDMALVEGSVTNDPNLVCHKWRDDPMVVIARAAHPLTRKMKVGYPDMEKYRWVLREKGSGTAALIEQHAFDKFSLHVEIILTDFEAIKNYVAHSDCLSCVSNSAMTGVSNKLRIIPVPQFTFSRPLSLVMHNKKYQTAASLKLKEHLFS